MSTVLSPAYASAYPEDAAQADAADDFESAVSREPPPAHHDRLDELLAAAGKQLQPPALSFANATLLALGATNLRLARELRRPRLTEAQLERMDELRREEQMDAAAERRGMWGDL